MELLERIKRDFTFDLDELKGLVIATLILAFIFTFRDWSLSNLFYAVLFIALSLIVHVSVQKIVGLQLGVKVDFRLWWYGLLAGLILVFITNGQVWWVIVPGGVITSIIAKYRLGKFRYGLGYHLMGIVGFTGPVTSIILGSIFKNINLYTPITSALLDKIFIWNLVYAVWCLVPIPPLDGHYTFFAGRLTYAFVSGSIFVYCMLILILGVYSFIWALIGGGIIYALYYIFFERGFW
jgi:Zn-dependent protease